LRKLKQAIGINAPKKAVWDVMADFGSAADWAPGMRRSALFGKATTGVGMQRIMQHAWGFIIEEIITHWTEGEEYSFNLSRAPFPMRDVKEKWVLGENGSQTSLDITVSYDMRLGLIGALLDTVLVRFVVAREMRLGIYGLKHHVERLSAKSLPDTGLGSAVPEQPTN
jgi:hypothetical protein